MDLALAMGTFGFVVALGVFAFSFYEFKSVRNDLARHEERMAKMMRDHGERMAAMMREHGEVLRDIRDSLVALKIGRTRSNSSGSHFD